MSRQRAIALALVCAGAGLLAGCSGGAVSGSPTGASSTAAPTTATSSTSSGSVVPKVQNPLSPSALDGSPCDSALTVQQVTAFIGTSDAPIRNDAADTGPACDWHSSSGISGQISVYYDTKAGGGLGPLYQNTKPQASRWEPTQLQGYPAVAYSTKNFDQSSTGMCLVDVGIRDDLSFGVALTLGDSARKRGMDSCDGATNVANTVLTNLKGRS